MTKHYFAADGSYGDAQIIVVDTSDWSQDEWDIIENCSDSERLDIAYQLTQEPKIQQDTLPGLESI